MKKDGKVLWHAKMINLFYSPANGLELSLSLSLYVALYLYVCVLWLSLRVYAYDVDTNHCITRIYYGVRSKNKIESKLNF